MNNADLALLPVFLPLAGASLALFAKAVRPERLSRCLEIAGAVVGLALPWIPLALLYPVVAGGGVDFSVGSWNPSIAIVQRFDGLAWLVDLLGFAGAGSAYLYSRGAGPRGPLFTAVFLIQTSALAAAASTADLFNLFVCLEVLGLASYVLVAGSGKGGALLASFSYLAISSATMVFFLFGLFGLYRLTGMLSYEGIAAGLAALPDAGGAAASLSTACIAAAVAIRVAVMPVYGWLPDAHAMAPHAVSAVLSGVLIKTPLFALARLLTFLPDGTKTMELIGAAGAVTALAAVAVALSQKDAKRLLAYHSISQIGYITAAWGTASVVGISAAFLHAFFHALFKGLLFLSVGTATDAGGDRDVYRLRNCAEALSAAGDRFGITRAAFAVGALSICALPPFNGYAGKAAISGLFKSDWKYWALFLAGIGTVASFIKLSRIFSRGDAEAPATAYRIRPSMLVSMSLLASLCVLTGLFAPFIWSEARRFIAASFLPGMLGGTEAVGEATARSLYGAPALWKTAITVGAGAALFFGASTKSGKRLAAAVRSRPRSFAGLVVAFSLGLAVLGARLLDYIPGF